MALPPIDPMGVPPMPSGPRPFPMRSLLAALSTLLLLVGLIILARSLGLDGNEHGTTVGRFVVGGLVTTGGLVTGIYLVVRGAVRR